MLVFGYIVYRYLFKAKKLETGVIKITTGSSQTSYSYIIGDNLSWPEYGRVFSGIEVLLPKSIPHIYLDSHHNDSNTNPKLLIDKPEKLSLEGDFNKHFQAFANSKYSTLALSILSPDTLQTLIDCNRFDIELYDNKLRLITGYKVQSDPEIKNSLIKSSHAVLLEIAHRLKSLNVSKQDVVASRIPVIEYDVVKVGKRSYVSGSGLKVAVFTFTLGVVMWVWGISMLISGEDILMVATAIGGGLIIFPISYLFIRTYIRF